MTETGSRTLCISFNARALYQLSDLDCQLFCLNSGFIQITRVSEGGGGTCMMVATIPICFTLKECLVCTCKSELLKRYYADKFHKNKNNIKLTWRLMVLGNNPNRNIYTKFNIKDQCITDQQEIANHVSSFFSSIGTQISQQIRNHDQIDHRRYLINRPVTTFHFHQINTYDVMCIISKLQNKKRTGYDGISTETIKILSAVISPTLSLNINKCITNGTVPDETKVS